MKERIYITKVEKTDNHFHEYPIIIHRGLWHFTRFNNKVQLQEFIDLMGITIEKTEEKQTSTNGLLEVFSVNFCIDDHNSFWDINDIPTNVKHIKGLSNGSIVDCYYYVDNDTIHIFRPNPNAKNVYKPMQLMDEVLYRKKHWYF